MGKKSSILLTDGHYKHVLGLARHFQKNGWKVWTVGNPYSENRFSRFGTYVPFVPRGSEDDVSFFQTLLSGNSIENILPIGAFSVNFFSENAASFSHSQNLVLAERESVIQAFDKLRMANFAESLGLKSPATVSAKDWLIDKSRLNVNYIIKSRIEFSPGTQTKYFSSREEGEKFLTLVGEETLGNLIIQERIFGTGEAFFSIYNHGNLLTGYTHRRIRETPISGGSSTCAETTSSIDTFESGKLILDRMNWHGAAMVEFKRDSHSGDLYLMEINPKFWGSIELGISHGVDFSNAIKVIGGSETFPRVEQRKNVKFQWPFHGDLSHLRVQGLRSSVIKDFLNFRVKKNVYISDPAPIIIRPFLILVRIFSKLYFLKKIKTFYSRCTSQGLITAIQREIEEDFGIATSSQIIKHGNFIVGPQISSFGKFLLKLRGVKSSVSLQSEFNDRINDLTFEAHLHLPCQEFHALCPNQLLEGVKFLKAQAEQGKTTYIHCREGVSRAPYLLAAYFVSLGYTTDQAFEFIFEHRHFINPLDVHLRSIQDSFKLQN